MRASFEESRQRYGSPRIHEDLLEQAERVSRKRVIRLMQEVSRPSWISSPGSPWGGLHHSDQGCTYTSEDYQAVLEANGITCSMSRRGNCHDNAVMETFFSSVKSEVADRFESCGDAKMELFDYIEVFYDQRRRHSTLGQISPAAFERRATHAA